jgi:hypothetical protein
MACASTGREMQQLRMPSVRPSSRGANLCFIAVKEKLNFKFNHLYLAKATHGGIPSSSF